MATGRVGGNFLRRVPNTVDKSPFRTRNLFPARRRISRRRSAGPFGTGVYYRIRNGVTVSCACAAEYIGFVTCAAGFYICTMDRETRCCRVNGERLTIATCSPVGGFSEKTLIFALPFKRTGSDES